MSHTERTTHLPPGTVITDTDLRSIYIGRLPDDAQESDLRQMFASCGEIKRCTIVKNMKSGSSKGVAFIEFCDRSSMAPALAMDGQPLKGSPLSVVEKRTRQQQPQMNSSAPYYRPQTNNQSVMNPAMMMAAAYWPMQAAMMRNAMMRGRPRPVGNRFGNMRGRMPPMNYNNQYGGDSFNTSVDDGQMYDESMWSNNEMNDSWNNGNSGGSGSWPASQQFRGRAALSHRGGVTRSTRRPRGSVISRMDSGGFTEGTYRYPNQSVNSARYW